MEKCQVCFMLQSLRQQYRLWKCVWTYPRYFFLQQKRVNNLKWLLKCVKGKCSIFPLHFILLFLSLLLIYANAIPTKYPYLSPRIIWCRNALGIFHKKKVEEKQKTQTELNIFASSFLWHQKLVKRRQEQVLADISAIVEVHILEDHWPCQKTKTLKLDFGACLHTEEWTLINTFQWQKWPSISGFRDHCANVQSVDIPQKKRIILQLFQSMRNTRLSQQRFWHCHENRVTRMSPTIP